MSHGKERHQTDCLNCGAEVRGHYCHICGQQNLEPKESVWSLISHFVYDITHFDGKFFSSLKFLLLRPGFLSKEYMRGRRASYLNPIKMYVFTSAIFFIIMLSANKPGLVNTGGAEKGTLEERADLLRQIQLATDSATIARLQKKLRANDTLTVVWERVGVIRQTPTLADSTRKGILASMDDDFAVISPGGRKLPRTIEAYDSIQHLLPNHQRDGWLTRYVSHKGIELNNKYKGDSKEFQERFLEHIIHSIPKMMFVSLPLVAFFLMLLYWRHKQFYYANHGILIIHVYIAVYIFILVARLFGWLGHVSHWNIFHGLQTLVYVFVFYYLFQSLRVFFGQSVAKTLLKYFLFLLMVAVLFAFLGAGFAVNSLLHV